MAFYTVPDFGPSDLLTSAYEGKRNVKIASESAFSAAGASGKAFARTLPISIPAGASYSVRIEKNSNIAIRYINAKGLYVEAVNGAVSGTITALERLISTNGLIAPTFFGSIEIYNAEAVGEVVLGNDDSLNESFYPDGAFVVNLINNTGSTVSTFLSIGVEQISSAGVYIILEPNTLLTPTTEMSIFNGAN